MGKYIRLSAEEKWEAIEPIINKHQSANARATEMGVRPKKLQEWVRKYEADGMAGLENHKTWTQYPEALKKDAVEDFLIRKMSKNSIVKKYNISSDSVLSRWITWYTGGKTLEATSTGRVGTDMGKSRKTTFEERVEIAQFALAREKDYKEAIDKYGVSYTQVHSWVKKYEQQGESALQDGRGRNKKPEELTEIEKLRLEIKELKARNEYLEMKEAVGKKLEELERRHGRFH